MVGLIRLWGFEEEDVQEDIEASQAGELDNNNSSSSGNNNNRYT